jgi:hypothetical protein
MERAMPEFAYKARNHAGSDVIGTISATTRRDALCALGDRELFPLSVEDAAPARIQWQRKRRIKTHLLATTLTQLADLLQSGVPLLRSLDVLAEQAVHPALAEVLGDVRNQVAEGKPLDEAMARHPQAFSELTISMVRAGSEGAFLEDALKRTADFLEKQEELRGRIVGAMTYPAILATAGCCITVVLIVFFVPKFSELFARLEEQGGLPMPTVMLLAISALLGKYGLFVAAGLAAAAYAVRRKLRTEQGRLFADRAKLKIPIAGKIFLGYAISRFCRVQWRATAEIVGDQQRLDRQPRAGPGHTGIGRKRFVGRNPGQAVGRLRTDPPPGDGHDRRGRGVEQPGQRVDPYCRRNRSADERAVGPDGPAAGAADADDHGQRDPVRVDRVITARVPNEFHDHLGRAEIPPPKFVFCFKYLSLRRLATGGRSRCHVTKTIVPGGQASR